MTEDRDIERTCKCCYAPAGDPCHCRYVKVSQRVFPDGPSLPGGVVCCYHWKDLSGEGQDP